MTIRARKRFGQHFLHDRSVIARIVEAIDPRPNERIVEIGPGRGALTTELLTHIDSLTAIEIDRDLAAELSTRFSPDKLHLIVADALKTDFTDLRGTGPKLRIAGNLPYNISTPILFHLLEHRDAIQDMHFMLQKEVVDRMAAAPGSKIYGRLTIMLAPWLSVEPLFTVSAGAFRPAPKVDSTVVRLTPHKQQPFDIGDGKRFDLLVRTAFSQRRKTLRNALKGLVGETTFAALQIDPQTRPEQLTAEQFAALAAGRSAEVEEALA